MRPRAAARDPHAPQQAPDRDGHGLHADPAGGHRRAGRGAQRAGQGQRHHPPRHERRARLRSEPARARAAARRARPASTLTQVLERIHLTPGAEELVRVLKRLGYRTAVISGGFIEVVEPIRKQLGLDYAYANTPRSQGRRAHR
ncbi:MAG: haloacid dehalogenase-like hydrolase [Pseudoxanthomonas sp.]